MNILVVDDEYAILDFFRDLFGDIGHTLITASSVKEAKKIIEKDAFDIVIVDFSMPDGEGTEVVRFIKIQKPETKILGISATEQCNTFYKAGADFFINKPFSVEQVLEAIRSI